MTEPLANNDIGGHVNFHMVITDSPVPGDTRKWIQFRIDTPFAGYAVGLDPKQLLSILPDFYTNSVKICQEAIDASTASGIVVATADALRILEKDHPHG